MTQLDLNFNAKPMSRQCQKLYNRLCLGPVKNSELRDDTDLLEYRRRFKDLRDFHGIKIKKEYIGHGLYEYSLD